MTATTIDSEVNPFKALLDAFALPVGDSLVQQDTDNDTLIFARLDEDHVSLTVNDGEPNILTRRDVLDRLDAFLEVSASLFGSAPNPADLGITPVDQMVILAWIAEETLGA